jgi:hypothetical protein
MITTLMRWGRTDCNGGSVPECHREVKPTRVEPPPTENRARRSVSKTARELASEHSRQMAGSVLHLAHSLPEDMAAADVVVWARRKPGGEVRGRRLLRRIAANLAQQGQSNGLHSGNFASHPLQTACRPRSVGRNRSPHFPPFFRLFLALRLRFRSGGSGFLLGSTRGSKRSGSCSISTSHSTTCR